MRHPQLGGDVKPEVAAVLQRGITKADAVHTTLQQSHTCIMLLNPSCCDQRLLHTALCVCVHVSRHLQAPKFERWRVLVTVWLEIAHLLEYGLEQQRFQQGIQLLPNILNDCREPKLHGVLELAHCICGVA